MPPKKETKLGPRGMDALDQLQEYSWRGVSFPTTTFDVQIRNDLAQHKYVGVNGANLESTGIAPFQYSAKIPFLNGTLQKKGRETFAEDGPLYPNRFRSFIAACSFRGTTGTLVHPEFGARSCKLESCKAVWDANVRDGCWVDVVWIEDLVGNTDLVPDDDRAAALTNTATEFDNLLTEAVVFPEFPEFKADFATFMRDLQAIVDTASSIGNRVGSKIGGVVSRIDNIAGSVGRLAATPGNTAADIVNAGRKLGRIHQTLLWPVIQSSERFKFQLAEAKRDLGLGAGRGQRAVAFYETLIDDSLAGISTEIPAPIDDLINLNPSLISSPIVTKGTFVTYYKP